MELKSLTKANEKYEEQSSNCTFMELKFLSTCCLFKEIRGSNCTFMELKFYKEVHVLANRRVLIVPLWN